MSNSRKKLMLSVAVFFISWLVFFYSGKAFLILGRGPVVYDNRGGALVCHYLAGGGVSVKVYNYVREGYAQILGRSHCPRLINIDD